jgi:hypothetical protein
MGEELSTQVEMHFVSSLVREGVVNTFHALAVMETVWSTHAEMHFLSTLA